MLVVLGIIVIVLSLLMPMLGRTRESASRLACSVQIRQHMQVLFLYASDFDDMWPYAFAQDRGRTREMSFGTTGLTVPLSEHPDWLGPSHRWAAQYWYVPAISYYGDDALHGSLVCPSDDGADSRRRRAMDARESGLIGGVMRPPTLSYALSLALLINPEALDPGAPQPETYEDPRVWTGRRHAEVRFPGSKAAIYESVAAHEHDFVSTPSPPTHRKRQNIAACEGSVRWLDVREDALDAVNLRFEDNLGRELSPESYRLRATKHGVNGRDW